MQLNCWIQGSQERGDDAQGQSVSLWADSLTNISIGGLLSEASLMGKIDNFDSKTNGSSAQPSTLISDSFDAFIAATSKYSQSQMLRPSEPRSSILDAEDTCHAFSFKRPSSSSLSRDFPSSSESGYFEVCPQENDSRASKLPKTTKVCLIFYVIVLLYYYVHGFLTYVCWTYLIQYFLENS